MARRKLTIRDKAQQQALFERTLIHDSFNRIICEVKRVLSEHKQFLELREKILSIDGCGPLELDTEFFEEETVIYFDFELGKDESGYNVSIILPIVWNDTENVGYLGFPTLFTSEFTDDEEFPTELCVFNPETLKIDEWLY